MGTYIVAFLPAILIPTGVAVFLYNTGRLRSAPPHKYSGLLANLTVACGAWAVNWTFSASDWEEFFRPGFWVYIKLLVTGVLSMFLTMASATFAKYLLVGR